MLWNDLRVIKVQQIYLGCWHIDIHIPIRLFIPYESMDETPWIIRDAIYKQLLKLQWPCEGKECLYFFYYEDLYHLQIHTKNWDTMRFYERLRDYFA